MDTHNSFKNKNDLIQISLNISSLLSKMKSLASMGDEHWEQTCENVREKAEEDLLRVAVVGAIKSGKSTFVNSLFGGDYLKRGAGVVTSIVTRIHQGDSLKATLWFKSWDQINTDIDGALVLFPSQNWRSETEAFDIRKDSDRAELAQALEELSRDLLITNTTRNTDSVLLSSYLKGYERVKDIVDLDSVTRSYEGEHFGEHKDFAGDDALAVYLNDIQLNISTGEIDKTIEIADCQGSDSPNPLHLAMIQDYLRLTHLIIYVISSRTGVRQADIKFLSSIKKMGILENALFLVNFDFSEHDTLDDLKNIAAKIQEELSLIKPDPEIYILSALFNLFKNQKLSIKDEMRLAQWKGELTLAQFSNKETERFEKDITQKLSDQRYALLLKNHLARLSVVASGIEHKIALHQDILVRDAYGVDEIIKGIKIHKKKAERIKSVIRSTLDGAVQKLKRSLRTDVDRFFDNHSGVTGEVIRFIRTCEVDYQAYEKNVEKSGFSNTLYQVFQEVKRLIDRFMADSINPEVIRFIREIEQNIHAHFETVGGPYDTMVRDALVEYNTTMQQLNIPPVRENIQKFEMPDIETVRDAAGIKLPAASASMHYTAAIRTEAIMRLGFYRIAKFFKKLIKKPAKNKTDEEIFALKDGVARMRKETEKSARFHFKDFQENVKFQYVFRLADSVADALYYALMERFDTYVTDLSMLAELVTEKQVDKDKASILLKDMKKNCQSIQSSINQLEQNLI